MKKNIKQIVESVILTEDDGGSDSGGDSSYSSGYPSGIYGDYADSMGYGGPGNGSPWTDPLIKTFVQPLTDIFNTAIYGVKSITAGAQQVLKYLVFNIPKLIVPFMKTENWEITKKHLDDKLGKLHNRYAGVIHRNLDMLRDHDLQGMAFFLDPTLFLGTKLTQFSPEFLGEVLEVLGFDIDQLKHHNHPRPHTEPGDRKHWWNREVNFPVFESIGLFKEDIEPEQENMIKEVRKEILDSVYETAVLVLGSTYDQLIKLLGPENQAQLLKPMSTGFKTGKIKPSDVEGTKTVVVKSFKENYKKQLLEQLAELKQKVPTATKEIDELIAKINAIQ
jgi:hypothetical protein